MTEWAALWAMVYLTGALVFSAVLALARDDFSATDVGVFALAWPVFVLAFVFVIALSGAAAMFAAPFALVARLSRRARRRFGP